MNFFYKISIDHVNANYISGWCFRRHDPGEAVELQCYMGNQLMATVRADRSREDLRALGMHPTGRCGFEFSIEPPPSAPTPLYSIRVKRTGRELARVDLSRNRIRYAHQFARDVLKRLKRKTVTDGLVVFMHIPKTAGTSFNIIAQKLYGSRAVRTHIELLDETRFHDLASRYRYVSGHLRFGRLNRSFDSRRNDFYTIVREPYAQLHSHLKWLIQTATDADDTFFRHTNPAIHRLGEQLAKIETFSPPVLSDLVVRMEGVEAAFLDNYQTRYFLDEDPVRVTTGALKQALDNAASFKLIGTTEKYEMFITRFGMINSLSVPVQGERMNRSKTDDLFDYRDPLVRDILRPLVQYDLELFASVAG